MRFVQIGAHCVYLFLGLERRRQAGAECNKQQGVWEEEAFQDTCIDQVKGMNVVQLEADLILYCVIS
jgi:hypothetical protein